MNPFMYELIAENAKKLRGLVTKNKKYAVTLVLMVSVVYSTLFPNVSTAEQDYSMFNMLVPSIIEKATINYSSDFPNRLPISDSVPARYATYVMATAYNSEPGQTDDTPCITANGFDVCEHGHENIIATNNLPLGTRVRFPELHGDRIFYVMDRMNARYTTRVDFWMLNKSDARKFGKRQVKMEVL